MDHQDGGARLRASGLSVTTVHTVGVQQASIAADRAIVAPASDDHERSAHRTAHAPITVLVAWGANSASGVGSPGPCTAPDIRWLAPRVVAPELLLPALQQQRPDVLLLAQEIFDALDAEALAQLPTRFAGLRILLVAQTPAPELHDAVLRCHFHGVLPANCPPETCLNAIRAICQGEIWLPRALLSKAVARLMDARIIGEAQWPDAPTRAAKGSRRLSRREQEIVERLQLGLTNKEIARELHIMEDTVKKHLQNVFGKLGVRRRALVALNQLSPLS